MKKRALRATAALLSLALIHASFGPEAWAQAVPRIVGLSAPIGGASAAAAGSTLSGGGGSALISMPAAAWSAPSAGIFAAPAAAPASAAAPAAAARGLVAASASPAAASARAEETAARPTSISGVEPAAPSNSIQAGPRTAVAASRISRLIAAAKNFFTGRKDPGAVATVASAADASRPNGLTPARPNVPAGKIGDAAPPSPAAAGADATQKKGGLLGLGAAVLTLIGGLLIMQVGLEAQGAAMANLAEKAFGDLSILAPLTIFTQIGGLFGTQLAQLVIGWLGLRNAYYASHILRAATVGGMIFLLGIGHMPLALMSAFYAANGLLSGITTTAEGTIRKLVVGTGDGRQEKFRSTFQLLAEIIGFTAPIAFGALMPVFGPGLITAILPASIVAAVLLFLARKVVPSDAAQTLAAADAPAQAGPKRGFGATLKGAWSGMLEGFRIVWNNPALRYSFLIAALGDLQNILIYRLFAPGFGKLIAGSEGMSAVQGWIDGLYSLGGMLTAVILLSAQRKAAAKRATMTKEAAGEMDRRSMLSWVLWSIPALLGLASLALPLPMLGAVVHLPAMLAWAGSLTLQSLIMIPFGIAQVAASIKTNSFFTDQLPDDKEKVQKAVAFQGSALTLISIVALVALKPLFAVISPAHNPFIAIALGLIPFGALLYFLKGRLAAAAKPAETPAAAPASVPTSTPPKA